MGRITSLSPIFANRPSNIREANKKYFFALEGTKTEKIYIEELLKHVNKNLMAFYYYRKSSNVSKIVDEIVDIYNGKEKLNLVYKDLSKIIYDFLKERNDLPIEESKIESKIEKYISLNGKKLDDAIDIDNIQSLLKKLAGCQLLKNINCLITQNELINRIKEDSTYDSNIDSIFVIGDRDQGSFTKTQYIKVLNAIKGTNIKLIITNPCIEFWFLLHYTDCLNINKTSWTTSKNVAKLIKTELKKYDAQYKKAKYNASIYIKLTETAIKNSKNYPSDLNKLEKQIGTNFPILFDEFKII